MFEDKCNSFDFLNDENFKNKFTNEELEYIKNSNYLFKWAISFLSGEDLNYEMWANEYDMKILNKIILNIF